MPAVDTVLLPLCVGLTLLGVIATGIAWRRGNKGRVVQGVGLALAPIALYFSGLLRLLWDAIVAIGNWASKIILSPPSGSGSPCSASAWCCGWWAAVAPSVRRGEEQGRSAESTAKALARQAREPARARQSAPPIDDDMAEIEALLKSRGIE